MYRTLTHMSHGVVLFLSVLPQHFNSIIIYNSNDTVLINYFQQISSLFICASCQTC